MPIQSGEVHWFSEKSLRRYTNSVAWIAASRFAGIEATRDYPTDKQLDTLVDLGLKAVDAPVDAPVETPIEDRRRGPGGEPSKAEEMADKTVASFQQFRMRREPIPAKPVHLNPLPENDPRMHIVRFTDDFFHGCVVDFSKNGVGENLSSEIIDHHIKKLLDRLFSLVAPMIDPAETPAKPKVKRYTLEEALVQVGNDTINQWFHFTVHPKAASIVKLHVGQFQDRYESNNREFYPESELDWS